MKIEFLFFIIEVNPWLIFALVCAVVTLYLIKRGYEHAKLVIAAKERQGMMV